MHNDEISPNFLVCKFCRNPQFLWAIDPKLCGNYAFPQTFCTMKLGEIQVIYAVEDFEQFRPIIRKVVVLS